MIFIPALLILWSFTLMGVILASVHILRLRPDHCDDLWRMPRSSYTRLDVR